MIEKQYEINKISDYVYLFIYKNIQKIFKISIDNYYLSEYEAYKILLENKKDYNVENFNRYIVLEKLIYESNIYINIDNIDFEIPVSKFSIIKDTECYFNLYLLIGDFNSNNLTFNKFIYDSNLIKLINLILLNKMNATKYTNFRHCDFKIDNILILLDDTASIFDLDYSLFVEDDKFIDVTNLKINNYLYKDNLKVNGTFLRIFDVYLLSLSIIYNYNYTRKNLLLNIKTKIEKEFLLSNFCEDFYLFYIIFSIQINNLENKISRNNYYIKLEFDYIMSILNNPKKILNIHNNFLLNDERMTKCFDLIENLMTLKNN
jgi:hypothetical protein